jgi:hypothetical protein
MNGRPDRCTRRRGFPRRPFGSALRFPVARLRSQTNGVFDPIRQQCILLGRKLLSKVAGDSGGNRSARDLLVSRIGEDDERNPRKLVADRFEEGQSVRVGERIFGDDAVDVGRTKVVHRFLT